MDFRHILSEIEKTDPEVYEKLSDRRHILKSFGAKVAVAALPLAIGSLFKKAYGKTSTTVVDALNFALELEYFEYNFYHIANNVASLPPRTLIPAADQAGFLAIEAHEKAHVAFLIKTITALGGVPFTPNYYTDLTSSPPYIPKAYDFTGSSSTTYGPVFANVFNDYTTFLITAQTFEDTHIRALLGQLPDYSGNPLFAQVQQILATEGRHAAYIRLLRRNLGATETPAPWINNNIAPTSSVSGSNNVLQPFYNGEENTQQLIGPIDSMAGVTGTIPTLSATAAFDEPLSQTAIINLLNPFIVP